MSDEPMPPWAAALRSDLLDAGNWSRAEIMARIDRLHDGSTAGKDGLDVTMGAANRTERIALEAQEANRSTHEFLQGVRRQVRRSQAEVAALRRAP